MCIHIYVCMYICIYIYIYIHTCVYSPREEHRVRGKDRCTRSRRPCGAAAAHTYRHMYVCVYVCMYVYMCVCMYVCVYMCMHVCMYVCMYICMYVCMCVCDKAQGARPARKREVGQKSAPQIIAVSDGLATRCENFQRAPGQRAHRVSCFSSSFCIIVFTTTISIR